MNNQWTTLPEQSIIDTTIAALQANGIDASLVPTGAEAKEKVLTMLPKGTEVMNMISMTLETIGLDQEIMESGTYNAVKKRLATMEDEGEKKKLGAGPEWTVGSVHAVTQDGHVLIASNSGSQLPAYAYGAQHVVWIVGAQKIVKDFQQGLQRIYEHSLPLEDKRAQQAYGEGSFVSKLLVINREKAPNRIHLIFVNEVLGY